MALNDSESDLTFGVELEAIGFFRVLNEGDDVNDSFIRDAWPGYILVPYELEHRAGIYAVQQMIDILRSHNVDINNFDHSVVGPPYPSPPSAEPTRHSPNCANPLYHRWTLKRDASVRLLQDVDDHMSDITDSLIDNPGRRVGYLALELISPAVKASSVDDMVEVFTVIEHFQGLFKLHVNSTTGLHVHVGMGRRWFTAQWLNQIAALTWAADAILTYVHPDHRRNNHYCMRNRIHSQLAAGMTAAQAMDGASSSFVYVQGSPCPTTEEGAWEIGRCNTSNQIGRLMHVPPAMGPAYNFDNYFPEPSRRGGKTTIEFRQAAGSISPEWVCHWAAICIGVCRYAIFHMDWQFFDHTLVVRCDSVDAGTEPFNEPLDIFLREIGCAASSLFIMAHSHDQRLSRNGPTMDPQPGPRARRRRRRPGPDLLS
ncbi:putative amidoligase enzyme-domain-containing protein [Truncatella angustata]|uniref:Amidoligase enzyme-domain-containing protein n=1 Tax=Truncatella angustata TaxID=152316 RepID=A0A9P8UHU3_9PEZI|nr:putative amidoligase enzyme-domain-containing protein [Truncatella angustata]KAH6652416.1 putative amidoligase enzyme-domain-containing protein [Truncatella angustata]